MVAQILSKSNLSAPTSRWNGGGGGRNRGAIRNDCYQPFRVSCDLGYVNRSLKLRSLAPRSSDSFGFRVQGVNYEHHRIQTVATSAQMSFGIGKSMKWWEKGLPPNMKEVMGAQDLVDSLLNAGDKLVVVGFFSPGCGGCKALHPKICQFAEMNQDVQFLHVNYEEHKSMCYSLNVHVLPFFRFYKGAHGRVCSFSCTNATIKKFKDALTKYKQNRSSSEQAKGLEEKEMVALSSNKDLSFTFTPKTEQQPRDLLEQKETTLETKPTQVSKPYMPLPLPLPLPLQSEGDKSMVSSGR